MMPRRTWMREAGQTAMTGLLCGLMVMPQAAFAANPPVPTASARMGHPAAPDGTGGGVSTPSVFKRQEKQTPLTQQERVLHVLNRFTFGPRPGDVEAVQKMGLERWFLGQLQPNTIDDSAFEQRMNEYPALRLPQEELMRRFPSQQMVRMSERRDVQVPIAHDPAVRAIFADAKYEYEERIKDKAVGQPAPGARQANPPVPASQARMGHPESGMQASMEMAGGASMEPSMGGGNAQGAMQSNAEIATQPLELNKKGKAKVKDFTAPLSQDEVQAVLALPADQRVQRLVEMRPEEMMAFKTSLKPVQKAQLIDGMSPDEVEVAGSFITAPERVVGAEILQERLERDVFSERQVQAVMTDFWLNHFSVYLRKNENEPYYLPAYERDVILPHALGSFESLLVAVAQSPAMLMYLDNWESIGPNSLQAQRAQRAAFFRPQAAKQQPKGINENYARELMELHTLGVNGGYTQQDVIEVAKCFTGWTIDKPFQGGGAYFDEARHEPGTKIVLGHKIKENGQQEGLEVLHILATSPATAHFISQKLAVRFVSDDPPAALVNRMAATFLKSNGNIRAVLWTMYHSPEFWSPQVYRAKVKTPVEFMASALRASGASVKNPLQLVQSMDRLGMPIYGMLTPNGYSWKAEDWVNSNALISRMNFALVLSSNRVFGTKTDWPALLGDTDGAPPPVPNVETENKLEMALLGEPASDKTRSTVLAQFDDPTAQQSAEDAFKAKPAPQSEGMMVVTPASKLAGDPGGGGGRFMGTKAGKQRQVNGPGSPLDTMAGLLLGSPEFQRR